MDNLQTILSDFEQFVRCAICLESLRNPVTTRCSHNFCDFCLTKALHGKTHIPCPLCNKVIKQRSLKKALHLSKLVPLVHKMVNRVQEQAGLPYTLSQSTKLGHSPSAMIAPITNAVRSDQDIIPRNGDSALSGATTSAVGGVMEESDVAAQSNSQALNKDATDGTDIVEQNGDALKAVETTYTRVHKTDCNINCVAESDSIGLVAKLTVIADVHRSPVVNLDRISMGDKSSISTATFPPEPKKHCTVANGSVLNLTTANGLGISEINEVEDPYVFPISQKSVIPERVLKSAASKRQKPTSDTESRPKRHKTGPNIVSDTELERLSANKMIAKVNQHLEKVPISAPGVIHDKLKLPDTNAGTLTKSTQKKTLKKKAATAVGTTYTGSPRLIGRLLSESTPSSGSGEAVSPKKVMLPKDKSEQPNYNDKVSNWLESAAPSTVSDLSTCSSTPQHNTDDDLTSFSQTSVEHLHDDRIVIVKRRKISSPVKLDPKIQESVKNQLWSRDAAVFGSKKPRRTFLAGKRNWPTCALRPAVADVVGKKFSEKIFDMKERERKKKISKKKEATANNDCIFSVPGLSQGVSSFGTFVGNFKANSQCTKKTVAAEPGPNAEMEMSQSPAALNAVLEEIGACQSENYDIQDADNTLPNSDNRADAKESLIQNKTERVAGNSNRTDDIEAVAQLQQGQTFQKKTKRGKGKSPSSVMVSNEDMLAPPSANRQAVLCKRGKMNDFVSLKKSAGRNRPKMWSNKSDLPLLGESPTVESSAETPKCARIPSTSGVELGLLDFSEPLLSSKADTGNLVSTKCPRPEAVAETCRRVFQSLDQLAMKVDQANDDNVLQDSKAASQKRKKTRTKRAPTKNKPYGEKDSAIVSSTYASDFSMLPPSTSTAELDIPLTLPQCDTWKIPPDLSDTWKEETPKEASEKRDVNCNIIRNTPLSNEKSVTGPDNGKDAESIGCSIVESSGVSDDGNGTLQCLTNGWGGTKLRIFRTTSTDMTDTDSTVSGFSAKRKAGGEDILQIGNSAEAVEPATQKENHLEGKKAMLDYSTEVIPNSEILTGPTPECNLVRKSTRRNKGLKQSFDYVRLTPDRKKNDAEEGEAVKDNHTESKPGCNSQMEKNIVLQHIEEAIAETQSKQEQECGPERLTLKDKLPHDKRRLGKKTVGGKEKLVKNRVTNKQNRRLQTGKRTKENTALLLNGKTLSDDETKNWAISGEEDVALTWPLTKVQRQVTFCCSQPNTLPKHITDVSVKLTKLDCKISAVSSVKNLNVYSSGCGHSEDLIDASPMLFKTQEDILASFVNGPSRQERSISVDLSRPLNQNDALADLDFIQNDVEKDEADDVICCSWNEVEKREAAADGSCHEYASSTDTACPHQEDAANVSGDYKNDDGLDKNQLPELNRSGTPSNKIPHEGAVEDNDVKGIIEALQKLSGLEKSTVVAKLPQSAEILYQIIDISIKAVELVQVEILATKEQNCETMEMEFSQLAPDEGLEDYNLSSELIGSSQTPQKKARIRMRKVKSKVGDKSTSGQKRNSKKVKSKHTSRCDPPSASKIDTTPGEKSSLLGVKSKSKLPSQTPTSDDQTPTENFHGGETVAKSQKKEPTPSDAEHCHDPLQDYLNDDLMRFSEEAEVPEKDSSNVSRSLEKVMASLNKELEDSNIVEIQQPNIERDGSDLHQQVESENLDREDVIAATPSPGVSTSNAEAVHVKLPLDEPSDAKRREIETQDLEIGHERLDLSANGGTQTSAKSEENKLDGWLKSNKRDSGKNSGVLRQQLHATPLPRRKALPAQPMQGKALSDMFSPLRSYPIMASSDRMRGVSVMVTKTTTKEIEAARNMKSHSGMFAEEDKIPAPSMLAAQNKKAGDVQRWLDNSQPEAMSPPTVHSALQKWGCVTTGLQERDVRLVRTLASRSNGQLYPTFNAARVTHIIVRATHQRSCDRTLKYLQGIAGKKWIVGLKWVIDSNAAGERLPESDYEVLGDNSMREFDSEDCVIPQAPTKSRMSDPDYKHLRCFRCVCLPPYGLITTEQASALLRMCGAVVVSHPGELITQDGMKSGSQEKRLIIVDADMSTGVSDYAALGEKLHASVVSIEWVYESISRFEAQPLEDYTVTGFTQNSGDLL